MAFNDEHSKATASEALGDEALKQVSGGADDTAYEEGAFVSFRAQIIIHTSVGITSRYETKQGMVMGCSNGRYRILTPDGEYSVAPTEIYGRV